MYDPLAEFLGATEGGIIEYGYFDAVRLAGHSCPTVASAYWMTCKALASLYPDAMPVRGDILVEFSQGGTSGVTGVIANVVSMLTGAMSDNGFKGIAGRFDRRDKLFFAMEMPGEMRFTRLDTRRAINTAANLQRSPCFAAHARADIRLSGRQRNAGRSRRIPEAVARTGAQRPAGSWQ